MKNLINFNLYEYDFSSCAYNILKNIGWDVSDIPEDNKKIRNIKIGLLQKENPKIAKYLRHTTLDLINFYLRQNNISEEDVILRQFDGLILSSPLDLTDISMPIEFKGAISSLIFSPNFKSWLLIRNSNDVEAKGLTDKPIDTSFFNIFSKIEFHNKSTLANSINNIRLYILNNENKQMFVFLRNNNLYVPIKNYGLIKINKSAISSIKEEDIDKEYIWESYVYPFVHSIKLSFFGKGKYGYCKS